MITEKDIKMLKRHESRMGKVALWIIMLPIPIFFVCGCFNLWLAVQICNIQGYNIYELFHRFFEGIDINTKYSGIYLKAMERLITGLSELWLAGIVSIVVYGSKLRRNMEMRILETLREKGVIKE